MSDDEESFIILGSTPTPSMDLGESLPHQQPRSATLNGPSSAMKPSMQVSTNTAANFSLLNGSTTQNQPNGQASVAAADGQNGGVSVSNSIASRFLCGEVSRDEVMQASVLSQFPSCNISNMNTEDLTKMQSLISDNKSLKDNLEKSNLVLRRHFSMIQQYQSEVQTKQEEIQALNNKLTAENLTLKKQIIDNAEKYNAEIDVVNAAHQKQINDMKRLIDKYEDENKILNQELIDKAETFKINYETMRQENDDLVKQVSEKLSIVQNLSSQMEKMELEKTSFVMLQPTKQAPAVPAFIPKDQHDSAIQKLEEEKAVLRNKNIEYEDALAEMRRKLNAQTEEANYLRIEITTAQQMSMQTQTLHTRFDEKEKELKQAIDSREAQMKEMRHDLSELKVKNIQFEDTIQEKSEEIERLRKSIQNALDRDEQVRTDLARLEAESLANQKLLADKEKELKGAQEQVVVLEAQLQIYKNDFESERKAREDIAGEKEQIMTDLTLLQKRHQELMQESQQRLGNTTPIFTPPANGSPASVTTEATVNGSAPEVSEAAGGSNEEQLYTPNKYMCPICNGVFRNFILLNHHVQDCLNTAT